MSERGESSLHQRKVTIFINPARGLNGRQEKESGTHSMDQLGFVDETKAKNRLQCQFT
jgi:hypothetical protein